VSRARHNVTLDVLAIGGPLALIVAMRALLAPSPATATAQGPAPAVAPLTPVANAPTPSPAATTPEQARALEWLAAFRPGALESPMDHPVPAAAYTTPVEPEPTPVPEATPENPLAGLRLTAILGNSEGGLAAISGRVYKAGDTIRPGLTVRAIDAYANTVTLNLPDGTTTLLARNK
jgi:hypothetical protein